MNAEKGVMVCTDFSVDIATFMMRADGTFSSGAAGVWEIIRILRSHPGVNRSGSMDLETSVHFVRILRIRNLVVAGVHGFKHKAEGIRVFV